MPFISPSASELHIQIWIDYSFPDWASAGSSRVRDVKTGDVKTRLRRYWLEKPTAMDLIRISLIYRAHLALSDAVVLELFVDDTDFLPQNRDLPYLLLLLRLQYPDLLVQDLGVLVLVLQQFREEIDSGFLMNRGCCLLAEIAGLRPTRLLVVREDPGGILIRLTFR